MRNARTARRHINAIGQTAVIFALAATMLIAVVGLSVDSGLAYRTSALADRAASAASLAGVTDMPTWTLQVNGDSAWQKAYATAQANGYAVSSCPSPPPQQAGTFTPNATCQVQVSQDCTRPGGACYTDRLVVKVAEVANTTFLRVIGIGSHIVAATEEAQYRSPITLGQSGSSLGADDQSYGTTASSFYMEQMEGWGVDRQHGDALTPDPQANCNASPPGENPALCQPGAYKSGLPPDEHILNGDTKADRQAGYAYNPAGHPGGNTGYLNRGGYNYLVYVPATENAQLQVFHPIYAPDAATSWAPSGSGVQPMKEGLFLSCSNTDLRGHCGTDYTHDPSQYATMRYTIFSESSPYDRGSDAMLSSVVATPVDAWNMGGGSYFDETTGTTKSGTPMGYRSWVNVGQLNGAGGLKGDPSGLYQGSGNAPTLSGGGPGSGGAYYRLRVDMLTTFGQDPSIGANGQNQQALKYYSVRLVGAGAPNNVDGPNTGAQCGACTVQGINDLGLFSEVNGATNLNPKVQLLNIPASYAGQQVNVDVFDPGDLSVPAASGATPTSTQIWPTNQSPGAASETITPQNFPLLSASVTAAGNSTCPDSPANPAITLYWRAAGTTNAWQAMVSQGYCGLENGDIISMESSSVYPPGWGTAAMAGTSWDFYAHYAGDGGGGYQPSDSNIVTFHIVQYSSYCAIGDGNAGYQNQEPVNNQFSIAGNVQDGTHPPTGFGQGPDYEPRPNPAPDPTYGDTGHPGTGEDLTGHVNVYDNKVLVTPPGGIKLNNNNAWSYEGDVSTANWVVGSKHQIVIEYPPGESPAYPRGCQYAYPLVTAMPANWTPPTYTFSVSPGQPSYDKGEKLGLVGTVTSSDGSAIARGNAYLKINGADWCNNFGTNSSATGTMTFTCTGPATGLAPGTYPCTGGSWFAKAIQRDIPQTGACSFTITSKGGGGGGGGGAAYHGDMQIQPLQNYQPSPETTFAPMVFKPRSGILPMATSCSCSVKLDWVGPDGLSHVVAVRNLGPSINGNEPCLGEPPASGGPPSTVACQTPADPVETVDPATGAPIYNGQWLQFTLQVPASYAGGYWSLAYTAAGGITTEDAITVAINVNSSPVHLLPQP